MVLQVRPSANTPRGPDLASPQAQLHEGLGVVVYELYALSM